MLLFGQQGDGILSDTTVEANVTGSEKYLV